jgi:arylsulfatase A-like enzyme
MSHHVDLYPTLCELTGIARPVTAEHGYSLVPVFRGRQERVREATLSLFYSPEYPGGPMRHTQRALRTESWKLTWYPLIRRYQLFDLTRDPHEVSDLLASWRHRRRILLEGKSPLWPKDPWAAVEPHPEYLDGAILQTAQSLRERMIKEMQEHDDPLLDKGPLPPIPHT